MDLFHWATFFDEEGIFHFRRIRMETTLEKLIAIHRRDGTQTKRIMDLIAATVYKNPRAYGIRTEDDIGEMFSRFWNRIESMVMRYQENGASFEAYLVTTLRFIALTLYRERLLERQEEKTYISDSGELSAAESASRYSYRIRHRPTHIPRTGIQAFSSGKNSRISAALSQHLSILCVKCAIIISDDEVEKLAGKMCVDPLELLRKVQLVRSNSERKIQRRENREQLRNFLWFKILFHKRKLFVEYDEEKKRRLKQQIANLTIRYTAVVAGLKQMKMTVCNKDLADVFNVSKARVDSGQFRLRKQFEVPDGDS